MDYPPRSLMRVFGFALLFAPLVVLTATQASERASSDTPPSSPAPMSAQAFTEAVLAQNASLEAMRQAVTAAVAQVRPASSLDDPMLNVSVAPRTFGNGAGPSGDIEVSQALPWWGTLDARRQAAQADAEAARQDLDALRLRLIATARGAFADWVFVRRALDINAANQSVLSELRDIATVRYRTGQGAQGDILQADVERAMLRQQRLEWERDRTEVQARMNALLERAPASAIVPAAPLPAISTLPAEELLAQHVPAHPQLQQLEAQESAAEARERLAEKDGYPKVAVSAGYNSMWTDPAMRPMVGVSVSVPLDRSKYRAEVDAARAEVRRNASMLEDERASLLADLAAAYASTQEAAQSLALYRDELVPLARNTLDVARAEYGSGRGDFLSVLTAEQHRLDTELGLARAQSDYYQRLAELERVSGGALFDDVSAEGVDHEELSTRILGGAGRQSRSSFAPGRFLVALAGQPRTPGCLGHAGVGLDGVDCTGAGNRLLLRATARTRANLASAPAEHRRADR